MELLSLRKVKKINKKIIDRIKRRVSIAAELIERANANDHHCHNVHTAVNRFRLAALPITFNQHVTMENLTDKQLVQKIVRLAENRGLQSYRRYSGRGMFGATCIGFCGENAECAALASLIKRKTGRSFAYDNMAKEMIYYFPSIQDDDEDIEADSDSEGEDWEEEEDSEWEDDEE